MTDRINDNFQTINNGNFKLIEYIRKRNYYYEDYFSFNVFDIHPSTVTT